MTTRKSSEGIKTDGRSYKVLVVDDSPVLRKILTKIFTDERYEVCGEAGDGSAVLDLYKKHSPDVVTLDLYMPVVDGLTALKRLLAHDKNARVVMLTAAEEKKDILKAVAAGARGYIPKPPQRETVLKKIKAALE